jgi:alkyl sulfatase BDS1-like metallo-beta-lactamase superfamily hydrolase
MTEPRFEDRRDFKDADRGFIAKLDPGIVTSRDGRVVWDSDAYGFLSGAGRTRPTPACGDKGSCAPARACTR